MQTIERPWGVVVYGTASVKAKPDLVRVRFRVTRLEPTPKEAFAAASQAIRAVRQTLRQHGIPDAAVAQSQLDLKSEWSYETERKLLGYQCQAAFAVESRDLDDIQPLLIDLIAAGANELDSVEFDVIAKDELRAEARQQAVRAARRKADLYAEAADVRLGNVRHIEDVGAEQGGIQYREHAAMDGAGATSADLTPGHVVVSASVIVGLSILSG